MSSTLHKQFIDKYQLYRQGDETDACSPDLPGRVEKGDLRRGFLLDPETKNRTVMVFVTIRSLKNHHG